MDGEDSYDGEDTYDEEDSYDGEDTDDEEDIYDAEDCFSSEFRNYVCDQKLICHYFHNFSPLLPFCHRLLFSHDPQADGVDSTDYDLTKELGKLLTWLGESFPGVYTECLVQFWKAEELSGVDNLGEKRFSLTTRNQPFVYYSKSKQNQICSYRMRMNNIVTGDEGGGGVIGRVYRTKRLEITPNISYYSSEEYPHRNLALCCGIKSSLSMPIFDSSGRLVGVLEALFRCLDLLFYTQNIISQFQRSGRSNLSYLDHCKHLCGIYDCKSDLKDKSVQNAVSEIKEVMKVIGKNGVLVCAQTWILCDHSGSLSPCQNLNYNFDASYWSGSIHAQYIQYAYKFNIHLKEEEGVVGKAATSSNNLVYCQDVSQFNITQNPLAHFARHFKFTSCFSICLKSDLTQSQMYVLEFFLEPEMVNTGDLKATLVPILGTMKRKFKTFKLASGKEIGDHLFVQVIDARSPDQMVPLRDMNIIESCTDETDDPMTEDTSMEETSDYSASTVESEYWFTIKVNYEGDLFTFRLFFCGHS